jgi:hypothetical protein
VARIRTIKPEFWGSPKTAQVSRDARLLFLGLLNESDDEGRQLGSAKRIAGAVFPNDSDVSEKMVDGWLAELERVGSISRYSVSGVSYVLICGFVEHQKMSHPTPSRLPGLSDASPEPRQNDSGAAPEVLVPDLGTGSRNLDLGTGSIAPTSGARKPDLLWESLLEACGVTADRITSSGRGAYNRACSDLRKVGATPDEVHQRALVYREKWPGTSCTPSALTKHWAELEPSRQIIEPSEGTRNVMRLRAMREQGQVG